MNAMTIIGAITVLVFLAAGVQTARIARKSSEPGMGWLAANFLFAAVGNVFSMLVYAPPVTTVIAAVSLTITAICLIMFVHRTFYRDRTSPYLFFLVVAVLAGAYHIYVAFTNPMSYTSYTQIGLGLVWAWQAFLAYKYYQHFRKDPVVEDWVKGRYLLWFIYTATTFVLIARMFLPLAYGSWEQYVSTPLLIVCVILQYLTWAMPAGLQRWLNRNYKPVTAATPDEMMAMAEKELAKQAR